MDDNNPARYITGVLLAGGSARRMGGCDKCLLPLDSKPIIDHVIARAQPQVRQLLINTNSESAVFARYELPVIADTRPGLLGPLAGILAAMEWVEAQDGEARTPWLASFPADSPFFPLDLLGRLYAGAKRDQAQVACAASTDRRHHLFGLWSTSLLPELRQALDNKERKVSAFIEQCAHSVVTVDGSGHDPFFNINTVEDLKIARELASGT